VEGLQPVPLSQAIESFLDAKIHLRPRTQETYEGILNRFEKELPPTVMLQDVTPADLQSYTRNSEVSRATQRKRYRHLPTFFNWAVDDDRLKTNPMDAVDQPKKEDKETAYLRPDDVQELLSTIENHILEVWNAVGRIPDLEWLHQMIRVPSPPASAAASSPLSSGRTSIYRNDASTSGTGATFGQRGNAERRVPIRDDPEEVLSQMHEQGISGTVFTDRNEKAIRPDRVTR